MTDSGQQTFSRIVCITALQNFVLSERIVRNFTSSHIVHSLRQFRSLDLASACALSVALAGLTGCSSGTGPQPATQTYGVLDIYKLTGDVSLVHDPSIIRQGSEYYALSTDPGNQTGNPQVGLLPIRCSSDKVNWTRCGQVFNTPPPEVLAVFPNLISLWSPDVSYFNGLYHVYYAASGFGANHSLIGLATSPTMNPSDPTYKWTDQGIILSSQTTDNFNAIDPNIFVDTDSSGNPTHVWLTYGSFWNGIFQREINPATGQLSTTNTAVVNLATRPAVTNDPIEGSSLVKHNGYYYLFVSFGYCCQSTVAADNYQIAVGRSTSPNGPFVDQAGVSMTNGGGTILLSGNSVFAAPGGQNVYIDPTDGDLITFHALSETQNGLDYLFVNSLTWPNDWPQIQP